MTELRNKEGSATDWTADVLDGGLFVARLSVWTAMPESFSAKGGRQHLRLSRMVDGKTNGQIIAGRISEPGHPLGLDAINDWVEAEIAAHRLPVVTVTSRSRNLGYAWNSRVVGAHLTHPNVVGSAVVEAHLTHPDVVGSATTIRRAIVERQRDIGPGAYYCDRLFFAGVPVVTSHILELLNEIDLDGSAAVQVDPQLTPGAAAKLLGISRATVVQRAEAGQFHGAWRTSGGKMQRGNWRIPQSQVCYLTR